METLPGNHRIAVRWHRGVRQFRAYSQGVDHPDGGTGPWTPSLRDALRNLDAADLADLIVTA